MYSFTSPAVDGLEALIRGVLARRYRKRLPQLDDLTPEYDFTIVISAYNEATRPSNTPGKSRLEKHLEILSCWKERVVIVDDGSIDNTAEVARAAGYNVFRCEENGKKSGSIFRALNHLQTEYVVIADLDSYPDPQKSSLEAIAKVVGWVRSENLGGTCVTLLPYVRDRQPLNFSSQAEFMKSLRDRGSYYLEVIQMAEYIIAMRSTRASQNIPGNERVMNISGGFGIFRRTAYLQSCAQFLAAPQRHFSMEDVFATTVIRNMGLRTAYFPGVVVRTEVPCDIVGLIEQRNRWECGNIRNTINHFPALMRERGRREESLWNILHTIILRPVKYLTTGPLLAYGFVHPSLLIGYYCIYVLIMAATARANSSAEEFKQIREVIPIIPLYALLLNIFVYTKAWCQEMSYQANYLIVSLLHPAKKKQIEVWLSHRDVYLRTDSQPTLKMSTYQGLVNIHKEVDKRLSGYIFEVTAIQNPDGETLNSLKRFGRPGVTDEFQAKYAEITQAYALSLNNKITGENIPVGLGLTNHTTAVISSVYPEFAESAYESLCKHGKVKLNFEELAAQIEMHSDNS